MEQNSLVCWTAVLTIATFFLGFIAVFQDKIRSWAWKPKLIVNNLKIEKVLCKLPVVETENQRAEKDFLLKKDDVIDCYTYYFRTNVRNEGDTSAKNVEVIINEVEKYENNKWVYVNGFLSNNLIWSLSSPKGEVKIYCEYISPNTGQYVYIGHIYDPQYHRVERYAATFKEEYPLFHVNNPTECLICFDVSMKTYSQDFIIKPGKYKFKLTIGASNCKSISKTYELDFTGKWEVREEEMLKKELIITEIN
jgi:hypothetical protein